MRAPSTGAILVVAIVLLLGWEGWTLVNAVPADTISETTWRAISDAPLLVLLVGILLGHLFWQRLACKHCGKRPW